MMASPPRAPRGIGRLLAKLRGHGTMIRFSAATMVQSLVTMVAGIIILRWLDPDDLGLWQSLLLIQSYSLVIQLGVFNGLNRELPYQLGASAKDTATGLAATSQTVAAVGAGILLLGGGGSLLFGASQQLVYGMAAVFFGSACSLYRNYLTVTYRAERAFETLARIRLVEAAVALVSLVLVYWLGFAGLALRYILMMGTGVLLNHVYRPIKPPWAFDWKTLVGLLKVGVPLYAAGYVLGVSNTFPRVILLTGHGTLLVGLFAPAYTIMGLMQMLPNSIAQYIYPQMSFSLGATKDPKVLWPMAWKVSVVILVVATPFVVAGELLAPWLLELFFPKYVDSIPAVRWTLAAGVFMGASISVNALFSLKAWLPLGIYAAFRGAAAFGIPYLFTTMMEPLEGVALGYFIAQAMSLAVAFGCIYWAIFKRAGPPGPDEATVTEEAA